MGLFQKYIQIAEKHEHNKTNNVKIKSLNGREAIRETLDENNTLTVKQPVVNEKTKTKVSIGLNTRNTFHF